MLDFYSILDDESSPEYPNEELCIGSLSLEEHKLISAMLLRFGVNQKISYFEDSRFNFFETKSIYDSLMINARDDILKEKAHKKTFDKFSETIASAVNSRAGFLVFCD